MKKTTLRKSNQLVQVKKIFVVSLFMFVVAIGSSWAATGPNVSEEVKAAFKKEFVGAQLLEWNKVGEYSKATFIFGNIRTEAYFSNDGQLEGSIRTIFYSQLPIAVMSSVDKRFSNANIADVNEVNNANGTTYHIKLEVKGKQYLVKVDANGNFKDIDKLKK